MSGPSIPACAMPTAVTAELYRAKQIENYDTGCFRIETTEGVDVLFLTSHAVPSLMGPTINFEFDNGLLITHNNSGCYFGKVGDGDWENYGPLAASTKDKLFYVAEALREKSAVPCDIRTAMGHLLCINGGQESSPGIVNFPESRIFTTTDNDSPLVYAQHLQEIMVECFALNLLPSELPGIEWAVPSRKVDMRNYTHFPTGKIAR